jgi:hypothetical protein
MWCSVCGRLVHDRFHIKLHLPSAEGAFLHLAPSTAGGVEECLANGGGGPEERLKRAEMLLAWYKDFPTGTRGLTTKKAIESSVEHAWVSPFVRIPKRVVETQEFSTPLASFPAAGGERRRTYRKKRS